MSRAITLKVERSYDYKVILRYMLEKHTDVSMGKNAFNDLLKVMDTKSYKSKSGKERVLKSYDNYFNNDYHRPKISNRLRQNRHNKEHHEEIKLRKYCGKKCEKIGLSRQGLRKLEKKMKESEYETVDELLKDIL